MKFIKAIMNWLRNSFQMAKQKLGSFFSKKPLPQAKPKTTTFEIPGLKVEEADRIRPTKAYADQRQKAKRNRRRKPKRHMRNLYCLGR